MTYKELEEKYNIPKSTIWDSLKNTLSEISEKNSSIIDDNIKIMKLWQQKILEAIPNLDLSRASDVNYLADALKSAQSVNSMILKYSDNPNDNTKVIPVNINIQYNDNRNTKPTN